MSETQEVNPMSELVSAALEKDYNKANQIFSDLMGQRVGDILDQEKIKIANQVYNGIDPDPEDEVEDDDDQLELDLEDDADDDLMDDDEDSDDDSEEDIEEDESEDDE